MIKANRRRVAIKYHILYPSAKEVSHAYYLAGIILVCYIYYYHSRGAVWIGSYAAMIEIA